MAASVSMLPGIARGMALTPRQTEGPFYPVDERADRDVDLTMIRGHAGSAQGEAILLRGRVLDVDGRPLDHALVDIWQANHFGRYSHPDDRNTAPLDPGFQGWGLTRTDTNGEYGFKTIRPGAYRLSPTAGSAQRCRHIHFKVSRPGFKNLTTQMYFRGDPLIENDIVMVDTPEELRHLLIADSITDEATGLELYQFDLVLQADRS
ncbi:MAG: protocatechuate 3,4-dioxygenase [Woeseia sp.]